MSMNTHFKGVLVFSNVFDPGLWLIFAIWHDVQKGSGYNLSSIFCQKNLYLQQVLTLWTCVQISDSIIPDKLSFGVFDFVFLTFLFFKPKIDVFSAQYAVMSQRSVH